MTTAYEYWQHRATGAIWAVKLVDGRVAGATDLYPPDVDVELLQYLPYRAGDAAAIEKERDHFRRIDGRHVA